MEIDHVFIQYQRLERYYRESLTQKDPISFLDLAHSLRIWVEMKNDIDAIAKRKTVSLRLTNTVTSRAIKKILKGSKYIYLPLGSGVESPGIEVRGFRFTKRKRALSPDEIKTICNQGLPIARPVTLSFAEWLSSGVFEVPSEDTGHPVIRISREILIKRIANILGASHPLGSEQSNELENKFDPYIHDLHRTALADGYPATYYQLLEIAKDILAGTKILFEGGIA